MDPATEKQQKSFLDKLRGCWKCHTAYASCTDCDSCKGATLLAPWHPLTCEMVDRVKCVHAKTNQPITYDAILQAYPTAAPCAVASIGSGQGAPPLTDICAFIGNEHRPLAK